MLSFKTGDKESKIETDSKVKNLEKKSTEHCNVHKPMHFNILSLGDKNQSGKKLKVDRKITKADIVVASNTDLSKVTKIPPALKPKPDTSKLSKESKPNVVIVKQGLASTTNEMIGDGRTPLFNIRNSELADIVSKKKLHWVKK